MNTLATLSDGKVFKIALSINISIQENTDLYQLVCSKGMLSRTVSSVEKGRRELHG